MSTFNEILYKICAETILNERGRSTKHLNKVSKEQKSDIRELYILASELHKYGNLLEETPKEIEVAYKESALDYNDEIWDIKADIENGLL